ncbi:MAG: hypothetical protein EXR58_05480 [Chloroflexi bacterium]|nr:hypothetical protein [Chloroflexota bacterium]
MFGGIALKLNNRVFACLFKGQLVLKLSKERVDQLVAAHEGENFDPGMGRVMREWVAVDPGTPDEWQALMQEARSFVGALYA